MTHVMPCRLCQHPAGSLLWALVPSAEVSPVQPWGLCPVCDCSAGMCRLLPQLITCSTAMLIRAEGVVLRTEPVLQLPAGTASCHRRLGSTFSFLVSHSSVSLRVGNIISSYFCCIVSQENYFFQNESEIW